MATSPMNMLGVSGLTEEQIALFDSIQTNDVYHHAFPSAELQQATPPHQPATACPASSNVEGILSQHWRPCTGDLVVGEYMDCLQFPVSYRALCHRWKRLGKPRLQNLRTPLSLRYGTLKPSAGALPTSPSWPSSSSSSTSSSRGSMNLQQVAEAQESVIIQSIEESFERGFTNQARLFVGFASHLDIYAAVSAELSAIEHTLDVKSQMQEYTATWKNLLEAFEMDRTICMARHQHECIGRLLWGEMYSWPAQEIHRRFEAYQRRTSANKPDRRSKTTNGLSTPPPSLSSDSLRPFTVNPLSASAPTSPMHPHFPMNTPASLVGMMTPSLSESDSLSTSGNSSFLSPPISMTGYFSPSVAMSTSMDKCWTAEGFPSSGPPTSSSSCTIGGTNGVEDEHQQRQQQEHLNEALSLLEQLQQFSSPSSELYVLPPSSNNGGDSSGSGLASSSCPSSSIGTPSNAANNNYHDATHPSPSSSSSSTMMMANYSVMLKEAASLLDATAKRLGKEADQLHQHATLPGHRQRSRTVGMDSLMM